MASSFTSPSPLVGLHPQMQRSCRAVRAPFTCRSQKQDVHQDRLDAACTGLRMLGAGLAAAAILTASPAFAGVKFEKAVVKKVFQSEPGSAAPAAVSKAINASGGGPSLSLPSFSLDAGSIALPGAVVGIGGLGFLASKLDSGFAEFFQGAMAKDSTGYAGYEQALKAVENGVSPKGMKKAFAAGTKKLKLGSKK